MGFRAEVWGHYSALRINYPTRLQVEEFQPYYTFNSRRMDDLRLGAGILQEVLAREAEKESKSAVSKFTRKAEAEAVARQVRRFG